MSWLPSTGVTVFQQYCMAVSLLGKNPIKRPFVVLRHICMPWLHSSGTVSSRWRMCTTVHEEAVRQ